MFTVVSEDDWHNLCQQWDMNPAKCIRAEVELGTSAPRFEERNLLDTWNEKKLEIINISDEEDDRSMKPESVPVLRTIPEVSFLLELSSLFHL